MKVTGIHLNAAVVKSLLFSLFLFGMVAINEELFTRGYVQGLIRFHFGKKTAVIAGILLGVSREVSGGLWMPIGLHLTWNFFKGNVHGFHASGIEVDSIITLEPTGSAIIAGGSFGAEGSIFSALS